MEVKFKNFHNRHIMLELPTNKTDFLFENSQDFNQTTHARPQHPIVFIHNISLYFNCISSVKYVFKKVTSQSRHAFFCSTTQGLKFSTWFSTHFEIFDMIFNTVFNKVHTIGEFLCLKCVENILKKHFENFRMF